MPTLSNELRQQILTEFKQVLKLAPADYTENCTNVVMSIIATQNTALLKEVADKVIGADELQQWTGEGYCSKCDHQPTDDSMNCICIFRNQLRAEQRSKLAAMGGQL